MLGEIADFFIPLAELVENITISCYQSVETFPLYVVQEMLRRKCKYLSVYDGPVLSIGDVEQLVKFFGHLNKQVSFMTRHETEMEAQIGEYKVKRSRFYPSQMLIEHLYIMPKFDDILAVDPY